MAGLLKGLEKLGLKNLDNLNLYEEEKEKEQEVKREEVKEEEVPQDKEKDYLFSKTYDCPVCGEKFKDITVKANRARLVHMDRDLRPVHDEIEPLKYEAIMPEVWICSTGQIFRNTGSLAGQSNSREYFKLLSWEHRRKGNLYPGRGART